MALMQTKPTKFTDVKPGSVIEVSDVNNSYQPFEATVVEMRKEHGPHAIPALIVTTEGADDAVLLMGSGQTRVKVLMDSSVLMTNAVPPTAIHLRSKVVELYAMRFTGGMESAIKIIQWAAGKSTINYVQATDHNAESLMITTLEGRMYANVGDYVLQGTRNEHYPVKPEILDDKYETIK